MQAAHAVCKCRKRSHSLVILVSCHERVLLRASLIDSPCDTQRHVRTRCYEYNGPHIVHGRRDALGSASFKVVMIVAAADRDDDGMFPLTV